MAKIRGFKPETWTDGKFVSVTPLARLLFFGMWSYACDNGHVEDSAVQLKMRILPADNCDAAALLDELVTVGVVERHDGYLKVPNLPIHQHIDLRYLTLCAHCEHDDSTRFSDADRTKKPSAHTVHTPGAPRAPKVVTPDTRVDSDSDCEVEGEKVHRPAKTPDTFDAFWMTYPRKDAKRKAEQVYLTALKRASAETILAGAKRYRDDPNRTEQYTAMPATWLGQDRWNDGPIPRDDDARPTPPPYKRTIGREGW